MDTKAKRLVGLLAIAISVLLILVFSSGPSEARSTAGYEPPCAVKDPPFTPMINGDIVMGQISNRCLGFVYELGAYGCLQASRGPVGPWTNVWCEANVKKVTNSLTIWVDTRCRPKSFYVWHWRVQGYVWVDYDPAPGTRVYKSQTVTSPVTPSMCGPV